MKPLFWLSFALVAYTYAGYPLLIASLARLRPHPWQRAAFRPSVSVLMAVHNGASMLPAKLDHLLALDPALVDQIIVVSDGSADITAEILRDRASSQPRIVPVVLTEQVGKTSALNRALTAATGEILLYVDIRPSLAPGALEELLCNFADPHVGCVAGELRLGTAGHDAAATAVSGLYWRYEQFLRLCESAYDSPTGVYGGFYAARRALVQPAPAGLILDDMFAPLSIIARGYRSVVDRAAIVTDTWPAQAHGEFQRKVRTLAGNFQLVAEAPWVLAPRNRVLFQLVSHKLLRLAVPYAFLLMLVASAVLALDSRAWLAISLLQAAFWLTAAASLRVRLPLIGRYAGAAAALLVLNAAAVAGLYTFLFTRGPLWKIWSPTAPPVANPFHLQPNSNES